MQSDTKVVSTTAVFFKKAAIREKYGEELRIFLISRGVS